MVRSTLMVLVALALVACGDDDGMTTTDSGVGVDAGTGGMDAGPRVDAGPSDPCAIAEDGEATDTVGCNGGFQTGAAAADADFGPCTLPDEEDPQGSCTSAMSICWIDDGAESGVCVPFCAPGTNPITTSTCATGSRCFDFGDEVGFCFRDCDATHACPAGQECDGDGSCVGPAAAPPSDAGTPDAGTPDAGTPEA